MRSRLALAAAVLVVTIAACSDASPSSATGTDAPSAGSSQQAGVPTGADVLIDLAYADGLVTGVEPVVLVDLGDTVSITITSDVADEVHIHGGYDLFFDVPQDGTITFSFVAERPGVFLVELEASGSPLFELDVG